MSGAQPPGPLVGAGRAADVYDIGGGRVLRRYRVPPGRPAGAAAVVQAEAAAMRYLDQSGFPVPAVYDADGPDLVMERRRPAAAPGPGGQGARR